jgi:4-diphosphocytidyl-2-C-methyl-D-erythritol kinase
MQPIATWQNELINDFETPIFKAYPQLASIKQTLIEKGALYASMSGSGSTVYGIFTDEFVVEELFPDCEHYWI